MMENSRLVAYRVRLQRRFRNCHGKIEFSEIVVDVVGTSGPEAMENAELGLPGWEAIDNEVL
jgi:hypothetical protein